MKKYTPRQSYDKKGIQKKIRKKGFVIWTNWPGTK